MDGSGLVYLAPTAEDEPSPLPPRLPAEPVFRRILVWFGCLGVAVTALGVAGLVVGVRLITGGGTVAGAVTGAGSVLLAGAGGFLLLAAVINQLMRRAQHVKLDPDQAISFGLALAQVRVALGTAPGPDAVVDAQRQLWEKARDLQRDPTDSRES